MSLFNFKSNKKENSNLGEKNLENISESIEAKKRQMNSINIKLNHFEEINEELGSEVELQKIKLHSNEKELKRLSAKVSDEIADKEILEKRIEKIKSLNEEQESQLRDLTDQKKMLIKNIFSLKKGHEKVSQTHLENINELQRIQIEIVKAQAEKKQLEATQNIMNGNLVGKIDINEQGETLLKETKKRIISLRKNIENDNREIGHIEKLIERNENEMAKVDSEISILFERSQEVQAEKLKAQDIYNKKKEELDEAYQERSRLELEINTQLSSIMNINAEQEVLKNKLAGCRSTLKKLTAETNNLKSQESIERREIDHLELDINKKENRIEELTSDLKLLETEIHRLNQTASDYKVKSEAASAKIEELRKTEGVSLVEIDRVNRNAQNAKKDYEVVLSESLEVEKNLNSLNASLERVSNDLLKTNKKKSDVISINKLRKAKIKDLESRLQSETEELNGARLELNNYKKLETEGRELLIKIGSEIDQLKLKKDSVQEKATLLEQAVTEINSKVNKSNEHIDILNNEVSAQEDLISLLAEDETRLQTTNNDLMLKIGSLKGRIQIGEARTNAKAKEIEILAQENHELGIDSEKLCDQLDSTVRRLENVEDKVLDLERKKANFKKLIEINTRSIEENETELYKLDKSLIATKDTLTTIRNEFLATDRNKERFNGLVARKKKRILEVDSEINEVNKLLDSNQLNLTKLQETKKTLDDELSQKELVFEHLTSLSSDLKEEADQINCNIVLTQDRIKHYFTSITEQEDLLKSLEERKHTLLSTYKTLQNEEIISNEELTKIENNCFTIRSNLANIEADIKHAQGVLESNIVRKAQLKDEIESIEIETKNTQSDIIHLNKEVDNSLDELALVEKTHKEKSDVLKLEVDEKNILMNEFNRRMAKLNEKKAEVKSVSEKLDVLSEEKVALAAKIETTNQEKGKLLVTKDKIVSDLELLKIQNTKKRDILEGISIEVNILKEECESLQDDYMSEKEKTKVLLNSIEMMREQVREVKGKRHLQEQEYGRLFNNSKLVKDEFNQTMKTFEVEKSNVEQLDSKINNSRELMKALEENLASVEFDANLLVDDRGLDKINTLNLKDKINSYIKELPFVFKVISEVRIEESEDGSLRVSTTGDIRCDSELTKELLRSNVKGKFNSGIKFRLTKDTIHLFINPVNSRKTVSR